MTAAPQGWNNKLNGNTADIMSDALARCANDKRVSQTRHERGLGDMVQGQANVDGRLRHVETSH